MLDMVILGAGATGFSAAVYAERFRINTVLLGKMEESTLLNAPLLENWPGIKEISGFELAKKMKEHAETTGAKIVSKNAQSIGKKGKTFVIKAGEEEFETQTLIFATGGKRRELGIKGEKELKGKGVSYCAACDAALFKGKKVAVIGGSDSAIKEALLISKYASKTLIIYRGEKLKAEPINLEKIEKNKNIEVIYKTNAAEIIGKEKVEKIRTDTGKEIKIDGVFIEIGAIPSSELAEKIGVKVNEKKEIIVNNKAETNIKGVFAGGDVTNTEVKQAITASAQGVTAVFSAYEYLNKKKTQE
jgi:thioredoxin reductase (NADPH)